MSTDVKIAVIVAATLLLIIAVCAFDRWCARHLTGAAGIALAVDDPTEETSTPAGEEGEVEPVGSGLDLAADEAMALLDPAPTLREERVVPTEVAMWLEHPHVCQPGCADRPSVYMGPVVQGRRCRVCSGPTENGTYECGACYDAADRMAVRRADRA